MSAPPTDTLALLIFPAGGLGLLFLARRGFLRANAFAGAPERRVTIPPLALPLALLLFFSCQVAAVSVAKELGFSLSELTGRPAATAPASQPGQAWNSALLLLLLEAIGQGPLVLLLIAWASRQPDGLRELGVVPRNWGRDLATGLGSLVATLPLILAVIAVVQILGEVLLHQHAPALGHELLDVMVQSHSPGATALMIGSVVVVAPIVEEHVFRGLVQTGLRDAIQRMRQAPAGTLEHVILGHLLGSRGGLLPAGFPATAGLLSRWVVIVLAALFFAGVHANAVAWQTLPGLFVLGLVLGWLYERSGSLLPGIVLHAGFNAVNTAIALLDPRDLDEGEVAGADRGPLEFARQTADEASPGHPGKRITGYLTQLRASFASSARSHREIGDSRNQCCIH